LLLILPALAAACATASAPLPDLVTDRPDATESALSVPAGHVQLEMGYTFTRLETAHLHTVGEVLARIGLNEWTELRLEVSSLAIEASTGGRLRSGFEDPSVGVKVELPSTRLFPETALMAWTSLPMGSSGFGGEWRPALLAASAWPLRRGVDAGINAGWASTETGGEVLGSAALGFSLLPDWGGFAEVFGSTGPGGERRGFVDGGLTYGLTPDLQLDARVGTELGGASEAFVGTGLVVRW
jgi:hypothetical protein